ncbi:cytochrome P450, partial [Dendrothele bispora CBS 962.96]
PYPPGPKGYWLLGLIRIPMIKPWFTYVKWGKEYGDLIHFTRLGRHYLVINSLEATNEILERQARLTSDRPVHTELDRIGIHDSTGMFPLHLLGLAPYNDEWRAYRKLMHQNFRAKASIDYRPIEIKHVCRFLARINSMDVSLKDQVSTLSQVIMFDSVYGLEISNNKEDMPQHARDLVDLNDSLLLPGWDAFKSIPFIHLFPSWFPGGHHRIAHENLSKIIEAVTEGLWGQFIKAIVSFVLSNEFKYTDGIPPGFLFIPNFQKTMSAICTFFLAMSLYPDVQQKAQQELDTVLGHGKLPTFDDRSSLPYIDAIYLEVMRWHPAIPLGVQHVSIKDIYYKDYCIPKGQIPPQSRSQEEQHTRAMTHDESQFSEPDHFLPERHLNKENNISSILAYGFGRRVCVGRYMANDTIWITIASVLA